MNVKFNGVGAEPKKLAMLGGLVLIAGYFFISNRTSSGSSPVAATVNQATTAEAPVPLHTATRPGRQRALQRAAGSRSELEFRPSLKPKKEGEIDRASIDPTLKLALLDKVQNVEIEGVTRSLFESLTAPPVVAAVPELAKIIPKFEYYGPPAPPKEVAKVEPPPPPIPLKFYGFISPIKAGVKRAFFLDGDDIIVASEGQLIKNRYKIVRIGVNSAVVEDTQFKNNQQTLALVQEQT